MTSRSSRRFKRLDPRRLAQFVRTALAEDLGRGDLTTTAIIPPSRRAQAVIVAKRGGIIAGLLAAQAVFRARSPRLKFKPLVREGARVHRGQRVAACSGPLRAILTGERLALNLLSRLSGITTLTRAFVDAARPYGVAIMDTRKTTPLLRELEKYAVRVGGGHNHRMNLALAVLIKDNHIAAAGTVTRAVALARRKTRMSVEVEAQSLPQVREALAAGADIIMLDNLPIGQMRKAIHLIRKWGSTKIEISGGVTLANLRRYARLKPDDISVGALTHSAPALGFSLDILRATDSIPASKPTRPPRKDPRQ